jgi:uncharacterized protein (DUF4415 family)
MSQRRRPSASRSRADDASGLEAELAGAIPEEARHALRAAERLRGRGLDVRAGSAAPEKEKVSITLDKALVDAIRSEFGGRALSTSINELLYAAVAQARLGDLVSEMEETAGAASPEAYDRVLAQWFAEG